MAGYYVIPCELLSVCPSVCLSVRPSAVEHSCPLHNFDTVLDNFTKLGTNTLKCLSIGTPKVVNFPFVSNEKLMFFRCPSIEAHCNEAVIYLNFGTPKNNEQMENLLFLGVPIFKHIRV